MNPLKRHFHTFQKATLCAIAFLGFSLIAHAQRTEQAVALTNGSLIRGTVIDIDDTSKLQIQTYDGSLWVFDRTEVLEVSTVDKYNPKAIYNPSKSGFYNITDFGVLMGRDQVYSLVTASLQTISGYRINPHLAAGVGLGLENLGPGLAPVFADLRYTMLDARFSPFLCIQSGYGIPLENYTGVDGKPVNKGGVMLNVGAGFKHSFSNHLGLVMTAGYRHQQSISQQNYWWFSEGDYAIIRNQYNRVVVRLGLLFN